jgi:hypothetical protein
MRKYLLFLVAAICCSSLTAKKTIEEDHFVLEGKIFDFNIQQTSDQPAKEVQIIIYQDREIYVAFYSSAEGTYEFRLPIGHEYDIWFGGTTYVNKKVYVDSRELRKRKGGYELQLDIALFRPLEGVEFPMLNDAYVKIGWDNDYKQFVPDMTYTESRAKELEKIFKKIRKRK